MKFSVTNQDNVFNNAVEKGKENTIQIAMSIISADM